MQKSLASAHDKDMETIIARILQVGIFTAASVILLGGIIYLFQHQADLISRQQTPSYPASILGNTDLGSRIIIIGLMLLIVTPISRVLASAYMFLSQKDYRYTLISLAVLAILLYSAFAS